MERELWNPSREPSLQGYDLIFDEGQLTNLYQRLKARKRGVNVCAWEKVKYRFDHLQPRQSFSGVTVRTFFAAEWPIDVPDISLVGCCILYECRIILEEGKPTKVFKEALHTF